MGEGWRAVCFVDVVVCFCFSFVLFCFNKYVCAVHILSESLFTVFDILTGSLPFYVSLLLSEHNEKTWQQVAFPAITTPICAFQAKQVFEFVLCFFSLS